MLSFRHHVKSLWWNGDIVFWVWIYSILVKCKTRFWKRRLHSDNRKCWSIILMLMHIAILTWIKLKLKKENYSWNKSTKSSLHINQVTNQSNKNLKWNQNGWALTVVWIPYSVERNVHDSNDFKWYATVKPYHLHAKVCSL